MKSFWLAVAVLYVASTNTGLLVGVTPEAVDGVIKDYLPQLSEEIQQLSVPLIQVPGIGKGSLTVDLNIKDLRTPVFNLDTASSGITFNADRKIKFNLQKITMQIVFDWEIVKGTFKQSGSAEALVSDASLDMEFLVADSIPFKITVGSSGFNIKKLEVKLSNNPSAAILNWVLESINQKLVQVLGQQISAVFQASFQGLFDTAAAITKVPVGADLYVSLAHTTAPVIDKNHMHVNLEGIMKLTKAPIEPQIPAPVHLDFSTEKSVQVSLSAYSINSVSYAMFLAGKLNFSTSGMGLALNCGDLDAMFPGISMKFGSKTGVDVQCKAKAAPLLEIGKDKAGTKLDLECSLIVQEQGVPLVLDITVEAQSTMVYSNWAITGEFTSIQVTEVKVVKSSLDNEPNVKGIENLANLTFKIGRKTINKLVFGEGFEVPYILRVIVKDLSIHSMDGYYLIEGSPKIPN